MIRNRYRQDGRTRDCQRWPGLLPVVAACVLGCNRPTPYAKPILPVRVQKVGPGEPKGTVRYSGRVEAQTQVTLAFKVGGYLRTITQVPREGGGRRLAQAGDRVRDGQVLATIRQADYSSKLEELRGARDHAKAAATNAKLEFDRATQLLQERVISQSDFDGTKARYDSQVGEARAAEARVDQASISLSDTELRSPLNGIVIQRAIEVGDLVGPGTTGFIVADTRRMKILFGVPDSVQKATRTGLPVRIHTEALPGREFRGVITKIAAKADEKSKDFEVEATVDNDGQSLKVGMIATAEFMSASTQADAVVPLSAVVQIPGQADAFAVFIVAAAGDATFARLRPVVLGELVRNDVAITRGVAEGELVIVRGATIVRDGDRVAVIP